MDIEECIWASTRGIAEHRRAQFSISGDSRLAIGSQDKLRDSLQEDRKSMLFTDPSTAGNIEGKVTARVQHDMHSTEVHVPRGEPNLPFVMRWVDREDTATARPQRADVPSCSRCHASAITASRQPRLT